MNCLDVLLYLTGQTWTRGEESTALAEEIRKAMDLGVHVLLVHEMPGVGGQEARFGCEFGSFFGHPDGATPGDLLKRGIYSEVAVALKARSQGRTLRSPLTSLTAWANVRVPRSAGRAVAGGVDDAARHDARAE